MAGTVREVGMNGQGEGVVGDGVWQGEADHGGRCWWEGGVKDVAVRLVRLSIMRSQEIRAAEGNSVGGGGQREGSTRLPVTLFLFLFLFLFLSLLVHPFSSFLHTFSLLTPCSFSSFSFSFKVLPLSPLLPPPSPPSPLKINMSPRICSFYVILCNLIQSSSFCCSPWPQKASYL